MTQPATKQLFTTYLTEVATTDLEGVGTLRWDGANCYRWVYNATGSATVVGEITCHDLSANPDSTLVESIYMSLDTDLSMLAGVCLSVIADEGYGWIQVFGVTDSVIAMGGTSGGTDTAIGDYLLAVTSQIYGFRDTATQPAYSRNLQTLEVIATATTPATTYVTAFVRCL